MAASRYNQLSHLFKSSSCILHLTQLQSLLTKSGLLHHPFYLRPLLSLSSLSSWGKLSYSLSLLLSNGSKNISRSLPSLSFPLIRAFSSSIHPSFSLSLFVFLHKDIPFSSSSSLFAFFPFLFKSCGRAFSFSDPSYPPFIHSGLHLHCLVLVLGHVKDHFVQNSLISMYSQFGDIGSARRVFDEMSYRTIVSWNALMNAYDRIGDVESAERLFLMMPERNITTWNSFINMFVKAGNMIGAQRVFDEMPERDSISWNSLIAGYSGSKNYSRALGLFREMQYNKVKPTQLTLISVLGACAETSDLLLGKEIHNYLNDNNILIDGYVGNALLDMYAKCGCLNLARKVFDEMSMRHVTCWNAMIVGFALHGCSEEALNLFSKMEMENKQIPNRLTFLGVLIACRHKGLVKEGQKYFKKMYEKYKITPNIKHYGCMIDLLSRSGLVEEAYRMIKEMPIRVDSVIWKTVISACRIHKKVEFAELALKEMEKSGTLGQEVIVIMSNIYADAGRWNDVQVLREKMGSFGDWKKAGWSHIESIG